ncbi:hypothetical protein HPB49_017162 [Dermacentor silvarum]|uniref:Uncharacterized protein n=1 Tax=Dermacentor silvarum TaxID=543639 RepID=A0ACB8CAE8_DERSI|nr:hypothetical protein HPB49_017162 [Dermacentor silvarum]
MLLSAIHILAHLCANTPAAVVANCFRHSGFSQLEPSESQEVAAPDDEEDRALVVLLPNEVQLADYFGIDDGVTVAGKLTDVEIIADAKIALAKNYWHGEPPKNLRMPSLF